MKVTTTPYPMFTIRASNRPAELASRSDRPSEYKPVHLFLNSRWYHTFIWNRKLTPEDGCNIWNFTRRLRPLGTERSIFIVPEGLDFAISSIEPPHCCFVWTSMDTDTQNLVKPGHIQDLSGILSC